MIRQRPEQQLAKARKALHKRQGVFGSKLSDLPDRIADDTTGAYWFSTNAAVTIAIEIALATGRPLLVSGDPGVGKTSLARAVARTLDWRYLELVVTSRTEAQELLWQVDYLRRLSDAQLGLPEAVERVRSELNYIRPGVLWWAFDPSSAQRLPSGPVDPSPTPAGAPAVLLIDEIDKAEPDFPNNLLWALGALQFRGPEGLGSLSAIDAPHSSSTDLSQSSQVVSADATALPLVIVTTNGERDLSPPFLRRCVKIALRLPRAGELRIIAEGHLGPSKRASAAIDGAIAILCDGDGRPIVSTASFIDAARAAFAFKLEHGDERWATIRTLITGEDQDS